MAARVRATTNQMQCSAPDEDIAVLTVIFALSNTLEDLGKNCHLDEHLNEGGESVAEPDEPKVEISVVVLISINVQSDSNPVVHEGSENGERSDSLEGLG